MKYRPGTNCTSVTPGVLKQLIRVGVESTFGLFTTLAPHTTDMAVGVGVGFVTGVGVGPGVTVGVGFVTGVGVRPGVTVGVGFDVGVGGNEELLSTEPAIWEG